MAVAALVAGRPGPGAARHLPELPVSVTINEAIEIARRFGSEDSAAFVNGVLDAIATVVRPKSGVGREE